MQWVRNGSSLGYRGWDSTSGEFLVSSERLFQMRVILVVYYRVETRCNIAFFCLKMQVKTGCVSLTSNKNAGRLATFMLFFLASSFLRPEFFISWFTNPPTVIFRKVEKKLISKSIFISYLPTLNIICFDEKKNIFEVLSVYFWEWHC